MNTGLISQIIGPVVDVKFEGGLPEIYTALEVEREGQSKLVLEVQQQLSGGVVRTIAMTSTDGIKRGTKVVNTGKLISVPVGPLTRGRRGSRRNSDRPEPRPDR